jgi:hypothetical protein
MGHHETEKYAVVPEPSPEAKLVPTHQSPSGAAIAHRFTAANAWLDAHMDSVMWLVVLAGFSLRIQRARRAYLNGDETQIMLPALQHSLIDVYRAASYLPYGPLMNFTLHYMTFFGRSELYFRMPSVVAGSLLIFVGYKWVAETFNKGAGLVTGCILAFAPPLVILSAQVRHYIIQALFMACSLYCLERALREKSSGWMRCFGLALLLAVLTMYMSIWYIIALAIYAGLCILQEEIPSPVIVEWLKTQMGVAIVMIIAYATQLRKLRGDSAERFARDGWLRSSYFHPASQTVWHFLRDATGNLFGYVFANAALGEWMIFVFLIGIGLTLWGKADMAGKQKMPALSLVLPLAVTAAAGTLSIYPYGGSRHDAFLAVFVVASVSIAISALARGKAVILLLIAACLVPIWLKSSQHHYLDDLPQVSKIGQMKRALEYLSSRNPRPQVLMVDQIGAGAVNYYICHGQVDQWRRVAPKSHTYRCAGYQMLAVDLWAAPPSIFPTTLAHARQAMPNLFPDPVWVFYESPILTKDETTYDDHGGVFGKLEIYRVSP